MLKGTKAQRTMLLKKLLDIVRRYIKAYSPFKNARYAQGQHLRIAIQAR